MSCKACDQAQDDGDTYYVRVGAANVAVSGCHAHVSQLITLLREAQRQQAAKP
jgi:predicted GH43/DUF377 family glycosyl hydrolase